MNIPEGEVGRKEIVSLEVLGSQLIEAETVRSRAAGKEKKDVDGLKKAAQLAAGAFDRNETAKREGKSFSSLKEEDFALAQTGLYYILGMSAAGVVEHCDDSQLKEKYAGVVGEYTEKVSTYSQVYGNTHRTFHGTPIYWPGELVRVQAKVLRGTERYQEAADLLAKTYREGQGYLKEKKMILPGEEQLGIKGSLGLCLMDKARTETRGGIKGKFEALPDFLKGASQAAAAARQSGNTNRLKDLAKITAQFLLGR